MPIVTGQYTDPWMTVTSTMGANITVEHAVGNLRTNIAERITENFELERGTMEPTMLVTKVLPSGLKNSDCLSSLPGEDMALTVVFSPAEDHKDILKTHMLERRSGTLAAIDNMNEAIEKMNISIKGLTMENKELRKEGKQMKKENEKMIDGLRKENEKMIDGLRKENEKMSTSIDGLTKDNRKQEKDIAKLSEELLKEKRCRVADVESLRQLTLFISPIHLRVLLDLTQGRIIKALKYNTWEDLRQNRLLSDLPAFIHEDLCKISEHSHPSRETIEFVCTYNNIRRDGNTAAHQASQEEMREAVTQKKLDTKERRCLEDMYLYVFGTNV